MAYQYLSGQHTRLIYDSYGVPGLIMFEKYKDNFYDLVDSLRKIQDDIENLPEEQ